MSGHDDDGLINQNERLSHNITRISNEIQSTRGTIGALPDLKQKFIEVLRENELLKLDIMAKDK